MPIDSGPEEASRPEKVLKLIEFAQLNGSTKHLDFVWSIDKELRFKTPHPSVV